MRARATHVDELTRQQIGTWSELQRADPMFDSPFFRPEFAAAVAAARDDVEVAVLEDDHETVGFLPYHRTPRSVAIPLGDVFSDFQGLVTRQTCNAEHVLRDCGLSAWHFDHLIARQEMFSPYHWYRSESPYIDLSEGFEAYQTSRREAGFGLISDTFRKSRRIQRAHGPLQFEFHTADERVLTRLIEWKRARYRKTKTPDFLATEWSVNLLKRIAAHQGDDFSGVLSALYVGGELAAAHLGMMSRHVFHYWQPAYDVSFRKNSPGMILLLNLMQELSCQGVQRIDLGKGPEWFKAQLNSGAIPLAEGSVDLRTMVRPVRRCWQNIDRFMRNSRFQAPARFVVREARALMRRAGAL